MEGDQFCLPSCGSRAPLRIHLFCGNFCLNILCANAHVALVKCTSVLTRGDRNFRLARCSIPPSRPLLEKVYHAVRQRCAANDTTLLTKEPSHCDPVRSMITTAQVKMAWNDLRTVTISLTLHLIQGGPILPPINARPTCTASLARLYTADMCHLAPGTKKYRRSLPSKLCRRTSQEVVLRPGHDGNDRIGRFQTVIVRRTHMHSRETPSASHHAPG